MGVYLIAVVLRCCTFLVALSLSSAHLTMAQELSTGGNAAPPRLDIHTQSNGTLDLTASNAALDEVIRAVAAAAGLQELKTVGEIPRRHVTIRLDAAPPVQILGELLEENGISYVMTLGPAGRISRLVLGASSGGEHGPAATSSVERPAIAAAQAAPVPISTTADAPQTPGVSKAPDAADWPSALGIEPVNPGPATAMPETREALFQMVNGSAPITLPSNVIPGVGRPVRPDEAMSVNPIPPTRFTPGSAATASQPGAAANRRVTTSSTATPSIDPAMLQAPRTYAIPAPVVVVFPPPPAP